MTIFTGLLLGFFVFALWVIFGLSLGPDASDWDGHALGQLYWGNGAMLTANATLFGFFFNGDVHHLPVLVGSSVAVGLLVGFALGLRAPKS